MSLSTGKNLSHYEILGPLGAGAMGEVYRAKDTRLEREVAIKVLPDHFVEDEERMRRFEREAKTLAALNHPNVAQIFGVDRIDGTLFLVLELVPGETLEERLKRGPLPIDEAIDVCRQIALGLEAAHDAGVIHRDLKPANIRITPDGRVKVLDFGLAKAARDAREAGTSTDSVLSTGEGRLLGTPTYMAPEQARGKPIDRRVDIWAFGCVLYESLTARRAFEGETISDVLASVLEKEPDWSRLPAKTPRHVVALLERCFAKDARLRLRDAGDARLDLERPIPREEPAASRARSGGLARALPWVAAAVLGGMWLRSMFASDSAPRDERLVHVAFRLPFGVELCDSENGGSQNQVVALSPDGTRVVFLADDRGRSRLFLRSLDSLAVTPLEGTEDAICPFFSPDGEWIAFGARGRLHKLPVSAGRPSELCNTGPDRGGAWGPDGSIVFSPSKTAGLMRLAPGSTQPVELTRPDAARSERSHRWPVFLPGGDEVAFTVGKVDRPGDYDDADIDAVSISTGKRRTLLRGASFVRVLEPTTLVCGRNGQLFALAFEDARGEPLGSAVPVLEGIAGAPTSGVVYCDIARNGTLIYVQRDPRESEFQLEWLARDGTLEALALPSREYRTPRLSPDGKRVALSIGPSGGRAADVWTIDLASGAPSRLTFDQRSYCPVWSRDGERVAFVSDIGGRGAFAWKRADGVADREILVQFDDSLPRAPLAFTPDGDGLLFLTHGTFGTGQDLFLWSRRDGRVDAIAQTSAGEEYAALSADGAWLAYVSDEAGTRDVYVQDFPEHRGRWQVAAGAIAPCWSRDGRELVVVKDRQLLAIPIQTSPSFSSGEPRAIAELEFLPTDESQANFDVAPDGRVLVVRRTSKESYRAHVNVVLNWRSSVRAKAPNAFE